MFGEIRNEHGERLDYTYHEGKDNKIVVIGHGVTGNKDRPALIALAEGLADAGISAPNIQDGTVVHLDPGFPCVIGDDVTIGHGAIIHGCTVGDGAMISMGATILTGAKIGERAIIAAGAVVREGQEIPPDTLAMGLPAQVKREVTPADLERVRSGREGYVARGQLMRKSLSEYTEK